MWFFNTRPNILLTNETLVRHSILYYNNVFCFIIGCYFYKKWKNFFFVSKYILFDKLFNISYETQIIRIKYVGKAYRISKKKKILYLTFHYPTFNYLIRSNVKLKHRKKKKKLFKLRYITNKPLKVELYSQFIKLRVLNTYTKRGVYNNVFTYYGRKRKISTHR